MYALLYTVAFIGAIFCWLLLVLIWDKKTPPKYTLQYIHKLFNRGGWRRSIWNRGIKLWWHRLFIRKDEFHECFNMDMEAMWDMTREEQDAYLNNLMRRRQIAHDRDLARMDAGRF